MFLRVYNVRTAVIDIMLLFSLSKQEEKRIYFSIHRVTSLPIWKWIQTAKATGPCSSRLGPWPCLHMCLWPSFRLTRASVRWKWFSSSSWIPCQRGASMDRHWRRRVRKKTKEHGFYCLLPLFDIYFIQDVFSFLETLVSWYLWSLFLFHFHFDLLYTCL